MGFRYKWDIFITTREGIMTHTFHPLPLATPASCSPHPLAAETDGVRGQQRQMATAGSGYRWRPRAAETDGVRKQQRQMASASSRDRWRPQAAETDGVRKQQRQMASASSRDRRRSRAAADGVRKLDELGTWLKNFYTLLGRRRKATPFWG